jgi:hypothetical protein
VPLVAPGTSIVVKLSAVWRKPCLLLLATYSPTIWPLSLIP